MTMYRRFLLVLCLLPSLAFSQKVEQTLTVHVRDRHVQPFLSTDRVSEAGVLSTANISQVSANSMPGSSSTLDAAKPNLAPYRPTGWSRPLVVTTDSGSTIESDYVYSDQRLFIDWAAANFGAASTSGRFRIALSIDSTTISWSMNNALGVGYYVYVVGYAVPALPAGTHTVRLMVDAGYQIDESDETDNACSSDVPVLSSATPNIVVGPSILSINEGLTLARKPLPWIVDHESSLASVVPGVHTVVPHALGLRIPEHVKKEAAGRLPRASLAESIPASLDWSAYDSPVKNQGSCGACWAFAAISLVENLGTQTDLAEQVLVSCANAGDCAGGWYGDALAYVRSTGVPGESCYPYAETNGECSSRCPVPPFVERVSSVSSVLWGASATAATLKAALVTGPVVVSMSVYSDFDGYTKGIYHHTTGYYRGEHAVLVVGYNDSLSCFKAKNSWGEGWGETGYFKISYTDLTNDVHFGGYGMQAAGPYTQTFPGNVFIVRNIGGGPLTVSSISADKPWVSFVPSAAPISLMRGVADTFSVNIDWLLLNGVRDTAIITVVSNDPDQSSVRVKVVAIPDSVALPVQLTAFSASRTGPSTVTLQWSTASESNNYGFEVERSTSLNGPYLLLQNSFRAGNRTSLVPHEYSFTDSTSGAGLFFYRLRQIDLDNAVHYTEPIRVEQTTDVTEADHQPATFRLDQNWPNPCNPSSTIAYNIAEGRQNAVGSRQKEGAGVQVKLAVYDLLGREVAVLVNGYQTPGEHRVVFDGRNLSSGVYFYRLVAEGQALVRRLIITK